MISLFLQSLGCLVSSLVFLYCFSSSYSLQCLRNHCQSQLKVHRVSSRLVQYITSSNAQSTEASGAFWSWWLSITVFARSFIFVTQKQSLRKTVVGEKKSDLFPEARRFSSLDEVRWKYLGWNWINTYKNMCVRIAIQLWHIFVKIRGREK